MGGSGNTSHALIYSFKNRLNKGSSRFGCLIPLLLVLIAVTLTGCGSGSGSDTDFERMLRYVPASMLERNIYYLDWARIKKVNGMEDVHTLSEYYECLDEPRPDPVPPEYGWSLFNNISGPSWISSPLDQ